MALAPEIAEELGLLRLGGLRGEQKALADEIIRSLPREYAALIDKDTSILSLVNLSEALNRQRKIDRKTLEKMGEFTVMVADTGNRLAYAQTKAEGAAVRTAERDIIKKVGSATDFGVEGLAKIRHADERTIERLNMAKVAAREPAETARFTKGVEFLLDYFPASERVPVSAFLEAADGDARRSIGGDRHNRYTLNMAVTSSIEVTMLSNSRKEQVAGASSLFYLHQPSALFIGFVRATAEMGGAGLKNLIDRSGTAFARAAAKDAGKKLQLLSGEMEIPETLNGEAQAIAKQRIAKFMHGGWGILGAGTSFAYGQPLEDGGFLPMQLMVKPLEGQKSMTPREVATLVRSIYAAIYGHLPKKIYDAALEKILQSIPKEPLEIVRKQTGENRQLGLLDFVVNAGNDKEVRRLAWATGVVDKFMEMRSPNSKKDFRPKDARDLYRYLFPNRDEAEGWYSAIIPRLKEMMRVESSSALQKKYGNSRFHAVTAVSKGDVVGYTQFSTMPLEGGKAVVFWQYGGVADKEFMKKQYGRKENFRSEGVASAFYIFRHGIGAEDARAMGLKGGVAGTILEAEFVGQADNESDMRFTKTRLHIHRQMGAKAMMLEMEDGSLMTTHLQPRLSPTSNPILLHLMFRPLRYDEADGKKTTVMDKELAKSLAMSFIDNFDREGFDKKDVQAAREIVTERFAKAKRVLLMAPEDLPNICQLARMDPLLRRQVENDYGSVEKHEAMIKKAFAKTGPVRRRLGS